ncbi:MAG: CARDB domain-containing protein [Planctomycetota bacterium]
MSRFSFYPVLLAVFAMAIALPGCHTQQNHRGGDAMDTATSRHSDDGMADTGMDDGGMADTGMDDMGSGGMVIDSGPSGGTHMVGGNCVRTLYIPSGSRNTSTVMLEKRAPIEVMLGVPFEYTIAVGNLTSEKLEDVAVMDRVPNGLTIQDSTPPFQRSADGKYSWVLGDVAAGSSQEIRVRAVANSLGEHKYCAEVSYNQLACCTTKVVEPNITLTKNITPADGLVCDPYSCVITVTNTGTGPARGVVVRDNLPAGLTSDDGRNNLSWDVGTLNAGETREIRFNLKANATGQYTNSAEATADGGLTSSASASMTARNCELSITKSGPDKIFGGQQATYEISVTNSGNADARDCVVEDMLPANSTFVSASDGGQNVGGSVRWNVGVLRAGESRNFSVSVRAGSIGTMRNVARVSSYCCPPAQAEAVTEVRGIPAVLLEVIDLEDPIPVGSEVTYKIRVTNQGSAQDTNIIITVNLEDTSAFVTGGGATNHSVSGSTITFAPLPSLAPGGVAEWTVRVKAVSAGDVRFAVQMDTDELSRPVNETEATNFYN